MLMRQMLRKGSPCRAMVTRPPRAKLLRHDDTAYPVTHNLRVFKSPLQAWRPTPIPCAHLAQPYSTILVSPGFRLPFFGCQFPDKTELSTGRHTQGTSRAGCLPRFTPAVNRPTDDAT